MNRTEQQVYSQVWGQDMDQVWEQVDIQILDQVEVDVYSQLEDAMNAGEDDNMIYVGMIEDQIKETID